MMMLIFFLAPELERLLIIVLIYIYVTFYLNF